MELTWKIENDYLYSTTDEFEFKEKLAMFDLDNTLITSKLGKKFPVDENDWKFRFDTIVDTLKALYEENYSIIIVSNQMGIVSGRQCPSSWMIKLNNIVKKLGINMRVFCATSQNKYRKPNPAFYYDFIPYDTRVNLDYKNSFYCGDACGRKGDFSDTDYKFAKNCSLNFETPEHLFDGQKLELPKISYPDIFNLKEQNIDFTPQKKEMIIMIGYPGSGKSYVSKHLNKIFDYQIVNQDALKTQARCKQLAESIMKNNKCLIIDATNPNKITRAYWIKFAKRHKYTVRTILMTTSHELSMHNNYYRSIKYNVPLVPKIAYNIYKSKFVHPKISEGIKQIIELGCGPANDFLYYNYLY